MVDREGGSSGGRMRRQQQLRAGFFIVSLLSLLSARDRVQGATICSNCSRWRSIDGSISEGRILEVAGVPFLHQPVVSVPDQCRYVIASLSNNPACADLFGNTRASVVAGIASFSDIGVSLPGREYTIRFHGESCTSSSLLNMTFAQSGAVDVAYGRLTVISSPSSLTVGVTFQVVLQVERVNTYLGVRGWEASTDYDYAISCYIPTDLKLIGTTRVWPNQGKAVFTDLVLTSSTQQHSLTFISCYGISESHCTYENSNVYPSMTALISFPAPSQQAKSISVTSFPPNDVAQAGLALGEVCEQSNAKTCILSTAKYPVRLALLDQYNNVVDINNVEVCAMLKLSTVSGLQDFSFEQNSQNVSSSINGVVTFTNLFINKANSGYKIIFHAYSPSSGGTCSTGYFASVQSPLFSVLPYDAVTRLDVVQQPPALLTASENANIMIVASFVDDFGNVVQAADKITAYMTLVDPTGSIGSPSNVNGCPWSPLPTALSSGGLVSFNTACLTTAGTFSLRIYSMSLLVFSNSFQVQNAPASVLRIDNFPSHTTCLVAGSGGNSPCSNGGVLYPFPKLTALDKFGNIASASSSSVTASIVQNYQNIQMLCSNVVASQCSQQLVMGVVEFKNLAVNGLGSNLQISFSFKCETADCSANSYSISSPNFGAYSVQGLTVLSRPQYAVAGCVLRPEPIVAVTGSSFISLGQVTVPVSGGITSMQIVSCSGNMINLSLSSYLPATGGTNVSPVYNSAGQIIVVSKFDGVFDRETMTGEAYVSYKKSSQVDGKALYLYSCETLQNVNCSSGFPWMISNTRGLCSLTPDELTQNMFVEVCSATRGFSQAQNSASFFYKRSASGNATMEQGSFVIQLLTPPCMPTLLTSQLALTTAANGQIVVRDMLLNMSSYYTLLLLHRFVGGSKTLQAQLNVDVVANPIKTLKLVSNVRNGTVGQPVPGGLELQILSYGAMLDQGWNCSTSVCRKPGSEVWLDVQAFDAASGMPVAFHKVNGTETSGGIRFDFSMTTSGDFVVRATLYLVEECLTRKNNTLTSNAFHLLPAGPNSIIFVEAPPRSAVAGKPFAAGLVVKDMFGNVLPHDGAVLASLHSTDVPLYQCTEIPRFSLDHCSTNLQSTRGMSSPYMFENLTITRTGNFTVVFQYLSITTLSNSIIVTPSLSVSSTSISVEPAIIHAGSPQPLHVSFQVFDEFHNLILLNQTNSSLASLRVVSDASLVYGPKDFSSMSSNSLSLSISIDRFWPDDSSPLYTCNVSKQLQIFSTLKIRDGTYDLSNSFSVTLVPAQPKSMRVFLPPSVYVAGTNFAVQPSFQLLDSFSNPVCSEAASQGKLQIQACDVASSCSLITDDAKFIADKTYIFVPQFAVNHTGKYNLKFRFTLSSTVFQSSSDFFLVSSAEGYEATFLTQPSLSILGEPLNFETVLRQSVCSAGCDGLVLTVTDRFGNVLTQVATVSLALSSSADISKLQLVGSANRPTTSEGVAVFTDLQVMFVGSTAPSIVSLRLNCQINGRSTLSRAFNVIYISQMRVDKQPGNCTVGGLLLDDHRDVVSVSILHSGNSAGNLSTRTVEIQSGGFSCEGEYLNCLKAQSRQGNFLFPHVRAPTTAGWHNVTFSYMSNFMLLQTQTRMFLVAPGPPRSIVVHHAASVVAGEHFNILVQVADVYGNPTPNVTGNVSISIGELLQDTLLPFLVYESTLSVVSGSLSTDIQLNKTGNFYALSSCETAGSTFVTQTTFAVSVSDFGGLEVLVQPADARVSAPLPVQPELLLMDTYGNQFTKSVVVESVTFYGSAGEHPVSCLKSPCYVQSQNVLQFQSLAVNQVGVGHLTFVVVHEGARIAVNTTEVVVCNYELLTGTSISDSTAGDSLEFIPDLKLDGVSCLWRNFSNSSSLQLNVSLLQNVSGIETSVKNFVRADNFSNPYHFSLSSATRYRLSVALVCVTCSSNAKLMSFTNFFLVTSGPLARLAILREPSDQLRVPGCNEGVSCTPDKRFQFPQLVHQPVVFPSDDFNNSVDVLTVRAIVLSTCSPVQACPFFADSMSEHGTAQFADVFVYPAEAEHCTYNLLFSAGHLNVTSRMINIVANDQIRLTLTTPGQLVGGTFPYGRLLTPVSLNVDLGINVSDLHPTFVEAVFVYDDVADTTTTYRGSVIGKNAVFSDLVPRRLSSKVYLQFSFLTAALRGGIFSIVASAPAKIVVVQQPQTARMFETLSPAPSVQVVDAFDNPIAAQLQVSVYLITNVAQRRPLSCVLSSPCTLATVNGHAIFTSLAVSAPGSLYQLEFVVSLSATTSLVARSKMFRVTVGLPYQAVVPASVRLSTMTAGTVGPSMTVSVADRWGNSISAVEEGVAAGAGPNFLILSEGSRQEDDYYKGMVLTIEEGNGLGQHLEVWRYEGLTRKVFVNFTRYPSQDSYYRLWYKASLLLEPTGVPSNLIHVQDQDLRNGQVRFDGIWFRKSGSFHVKVSIKTFQANLFDVQVGPSVAASLGIANSDLPPTLHAGDAFPRVTVQVEDLFGNEVTGSFHTSADVAMVVGDASPRFPSFPLEQEQRFFTRLNSSDLLTGRASFDDFRALVAAHACRLLLVSDWFPPVLSQPFDILSGPSNRMLVLQNPPAAVTLRNDLPVLPLQPRLLVVDAFDNAVAGVSIAALLYQSGAMCGAGLACTAQVQGNKAVPTAEDGTVSFTDLAVVVPGASYTFKFEPLDSSFSPNSALAVFSTPFSVSSGTLNRVLQSSSLNCSSSSSTSCFVAGDVLSRLSFFASDAYGNQVQGTFNGFVAQISVSNSGRLAGNAFAPLRDGLVVFTGLRVEGASPAGAATSSSPVTNELCSDGTASFRFRSLLLFQAHVSLALTSSCTESFLVSPGPPARIAHDAVGTSVFVFQYLPELAIRVTDAYSNLVHDLSGRVSVEAVTSQSPVALQNASQVVLTSASATLTGLYFNTVHDDVALRFCLSEINCSVLSNTTNSFTVLTVNLTLTSFAVTQVAAGETLPAISLAASDQAHRDYAPIPITVVVSSPLKDIVPDGQTSAVAIGGIAVFDNLRIGQAGNVRLRFSISGEAKLETSVFLVSPANYNLCALAMGGCSVNLLAQPPQKVAAGSNMTITAQVMDKFGNALNDGYASISIVSQFHVAILGSLVSELDQQGRVTFNISVLTSCERLGCQGYNQTSYRFLISKENASALTNLFEVANLEQITSIQFEIAGQNAQANGFFPQLPVVTLQDKYGNPIVGANFPVRWTLSCENCDCLKCMESLVCNSSSPQRCHGASDIIHGRFQVPFRAPINTSRVYNFSIEIFTWIGALLHPVPIVSNNIRVVNADAKLLRFKPLQEESSTIIAGSILQFAIDIRDEFGNPVTDGTVEVMIRYPDKVLYSDCANCVTNFSLSAPAAASVLSVRLTQSETILPGAQVVFNYYSSSCGGTGMATATSSDVCSSLLDLSQSSSTCLVLSNITNYFLILPGPITNVSLATPSFIQAGATFTASVSLSDALNNKVLPASNPTICLEIWTQCSSSTVDSSSGNSCYNTSLVNDVFVFSLTTPQNSRCADELIYFRGSVHVAMQSGPIAFVTAPLTFYPSTLRSTTTAASTLMQHFSEAEMLFSSSSSFSTESRVQSHTMVRSRVQMPSSLKQREGRLYSRSSGLRVKASSRWKAIQEGFGSRISFLRVNLPTQSTSSEILEVLDQPSSTVYDQLLATPPQVKMNSSAADLGNVSMCLSLVQGLFQGATSQVRMRLQANAGTQLDVTGQFAWAPVESGRAVFDGISFVGSPAQGIKLRFFVCSVDTATSSLECIGSSDYPCIATDSTPFDVLNGPVSLMEREGNWLTFILAGSPFRTSLRFRDAYGFGYAREAIPLTVSIIRFNSQPVSPRVIATVNSVADLASANVGLASFTDAIVLKDVGKYTLLFSNRRVNNHTYDITVLHGPPNHTTFVSQPSTGTVGYVLNGRAGPITIELRDVFGNVVECKNSDPSANNFILQNVPICRNSSFVLSLLATRPCMPGETCREVKIDYPKSVQIQKGKFVIPDFVIDKVGDNYLLSAEVVISPAGLSLHVLSAVFHVYGITYDLVVILFACVLVHS
eukprot:763318-Hanusia_phi.AAC.15